MYSTQCFKFHVLIVVKSKQLFTTDIQGDSWWWYIRSIYCNLECSLGWVQTIFPKYFGLNGVARSVGKNTNSWFSNGTPCF